MTATINARPAVPPSPGRATPPGHQPARPSPAAWPATSQDRDAIWEQLMGPPFAPVTAKGRAGHKLGLQLLLDWLADQPGDMWQVRWLASGADAAGGSWRQVSTTWLREHGHHSEHRQEVLTRAVMVAISADLVRPSLSWLAEANFRNGSLVNALAQFRDPEGFRRLRAACSADPAASTSAAGRARLPHSAHRGRQGRHAERHHHSSIAIGTNLPFSEWGTVFPDPRLVDRVTFNAHIIETGTQSYRLRTSKNSRAKNSS